MIDERVPGLAARVREPKYPNMCWAQVAISALCVPPFICRLGASDRFGILSIALNLIDDATEGPPGGPRPVFPAGDLPGLVDDDARDLGRLFPRPGIGG